MNKYEKLFNDKIDSFSNHEKYKELRDNADKMLMLHCGEGYKAIVAVDFMDRIVAMPLDYIKDWLDGKNQLEWRKEDERMVAAIKGGWVDLLEQYPDAEIHPISSDASEFYKSFGFKIITNNDRTFAIKQA